MIQLALIVAVPVMAGAGLACLITASWYRKRLDAAEDVADAARGDAQGLAEALRGLQAAVAAGLPVEGAELDPGLPRSEALFIEALERDLRRPVPLRVRRLIRRAERAASQT
jgi:hypothetical protein